MKKKCKLVMAALVALVIALSMTACSIPLGIPGMSGIGTPTVNPEPTATHTDYSSPPTGTQAVLPSIADVVDMAKPWVVAIDTESTATFFRRSYTQQGAGSGWIVGSNGIIVTNYHVIDGADKISVTLTDGRTFAVDSKQIAVDPSNDLAVIRIDASNLPTANVADSTTLRVGDWVVAIGNPLGMGISAKEGIISRLGVSLDVEGQTQGNLIETSAAINPGNSGGPLVNMRGQVIGITSAKVSTVGVEGMGYAINIGEAMLIIQKLIAGV